jgi:hypothetical protein
MGRARKSAGAGGTGARALLIAEWDASMARWRIPGEVYAYEEALKNGGPVVISSARLLRALTLAGLPAKRFGFGGPDADKRLLLEGDELSEWRGPEDGQVVIDE